MSALEDIERDFGPLLADEKPEISERGRKLMIAAARRRRKRMGYRKDVGLPPWDTTRPLVAPTDCLRCAVCRVVVWNRAEQRAGHVARNHPGQEAWC